VLASLGPDPGRIMVRRPAVRKSLDASRRGADANAQGRPVSDATHGALYARILKASPDQFDALHLSGLAKRQGR